VIVIVVVVFIVAVAVVVVAVMVMVVVVVELIELAVTRDTKINHESRGHWLVEVGSESRTTSKKKLQVVRAHPQLTM
jgi:hypothetical protein